MTADLFTGAKTSEVYKGLTLAADRLEQHGDPTDAADPNGSTYARLKWWKDRTDDLHEQLAAKDAHADEIYKAAVDLAKKLEDDLDAERALADRLAESIEWYRLNVGDCNKGGDDGALARDSLSKDIGRNATKALAAWKEARRDP
jgi:hypothetical protein